MKQLVAIGVLCGALATAASAKDSVLEGFPRVIHGDSAIAQRGPAGLTNELLEVESGLVQILLAADVALAVGAGSRFAILRPDKAEGKFVVMVLAEPVLALHTGLDKIQTLRLGGHLVDTGPREPDSARNEWVVPLFAPDGSAAKGLSAKDLQLGSWVMVRQQAYLDSLRIDVRPINQAIATFIRRLFPSGGK